MNPARTAEPIPPEESRLMTRIPRTRRWLRDRRVLVAFVVAVPFAVLGAVTVIQWVIG